MPPRRNRAQKSKRANRLGYVSEPAYPERPLRMTTRTTSVQSSNSIGSSKLQLNFAEDFEDERPRKVARTSDSQDNIYSSPSSSVAMVAAATDDGFNGNDSLSDRDATGDLDDVDEHVSDDVQDNSQDEIGAKSGIDPSKYGLVSRQSTPSFEEAELALQPLESPVLESIRKIRSTQPKTGKSTAHGTPEPDKKGSLIARLPGRRRAPHPDLDIEVDLRRQLELKVAYRAVAKALKPVLSELAERTARDLDKNRDLYKSLPEYDWIVSDLSKHLKGRLKILAAELHEEERRLEREHAAVEELINERYEHKFRDSSEDHILHCKRHMLSLVQEARTEEDTDATDYEDEIMSGTYQVDKTTHIRRPIDKGYQSRSRQFVQIGQSWNDLDSRRKMMAMQKAVDATSVNPKPRDFAVFDGHARRMALTSLNILQLIDAGAEADQMARWPAPEQISNSDAIGLQALADATNIELFQRRKSLRRGDDSTTAAQPHSSALQFHNLSTAGIANIAGSTADPTQVAFKSKANRRRKSPRFHPILVPQSYMYQGQTLPPSQILPPHSYYPPHQVPIPTIYPQHEHGKETLQSQQNRVEPLLSNKSAVMDNADAAMQTPGSGSIADRVRDEFVKYEERVVNDTNLGVNEGMPPDRRVSAKTAKIQTWAPFSNSMPPPSALLPKYIKENGLVRPELDVTSPITPTIGPAKPTAEWPGFSSNTDANHGRAASFDAQIAQRSTFPGLVNQASPRNDAVLSLQREAIVPKSSPHENGKSSHQSLMNYPPTDNHLSTLSSQTPEPSPFFQRTGIASSSQFVHNRIGPLLSQPLAGQQRNSSTVASSNQSIPISMPNPSSSLRVPADLRNSRPSTPSSFGPTQINPGMVSQQQQPPPGHASRSRSPLPPLAPQPTTNNMQIDQQAGQAGHQRILPANMDPRRYSRGGDESNVLTPLHPDRSAARQSHAGAQENNLHNNSSASSPAIISASPAGTSFREYAYPGHLRRSQYNQEQSPSVSQRQPPNQLPSSNQRTSATSTGNPTNQKQGQQSFRWQIYANIAPAPQATSSSVVYRQAGPTRHQNQNPTQGQMSFGQLQHQQQQHHPQQQGRQTPFSPQSHTSPPKLGAMFAETQAPPEKDPFTMSQSPDKTLRAGAKSTRVLDNNTGA